MLEVEDEKLRRWIDQETRFLRRDKARINRISLSTLQELRQLARYNQQRAKAAIWKRQRERLSIANLGVLAISLLSITVHDRSRRGHLLRRDLLNKNGRPNPNFVLSGMLCQLANYSLAVIDMSERGLEGPSRALLRMTEELASQIIVLLSDREVFQEYAVWREEREAKHIWYELFSPKNLQRRLGEIEKSLGIPDDLLVALRSTREESHAYLSQSVHHSFASVTAGSRCRSYESDHLAFGLFGGPNRGVPGRLRHLLEVLWYFSALFDTMLKRKHGLVLENSFSKDWFGAMYLMLLFEEASVNT